MQFIVILILDLYLAMVLQIYLLLVIVMKRIVVQLMSHLVYNMTIILNIDLHYMWIVVDLMKIIGLQYWIMKFTLTNIPFSFPSFVTFLLCYPL